MNAESAEKKRESAEKKRESAEDRPKGILCVLSFELCALCVQSF
jgi:hypothetical protein